LVEGLIGYSGLVGSNLCQHKQFDHLYNSKNIQTIGEKVFDRVICAGVSGFKTWANENPEEDRRQIENLLSHLRKLKTKEFVLISTIDVYADINAQKDEHASALKPTHSYGQLRWALERDIVELFPECFIVRLPGVYGINLKKNLIYDLLHCHFLEGAHPDASYQWYWLGHLMKDINCIIQNNIKLINLFPEPISVAELIESVFSTQYSCRNEGIWLEGPQQLVERSATAPDRQYDTQTAYSTLFGQPQGFRYTQTKDKVLEEIRSYRTWFKQRRIQDA
jgi:dTDP-4-dehydrorhamnose reductase